MRSDSQSPKSRPSKRFARCALLILTLTMLVHLDAKVSLGGGGPENLVLVINADSAASKLIGNHYVHGRQIPGRNVIYLNGIPNREKISLDEFRELILIPVARQIEERKIAKTTDYIVYSAGFPTIVSVDRHFNKLLDQLKKQAGGADVNTRIFGSQASINALTYYAAAVLKDEPGYMLLNSNSYYRHPAQMILRRPFVGKRQQEFEAAISQFADEDNESTAAIQSLESLAKSNPFQVAVSYWLARFYAQQGDAKSATKWITQAIRSGWSFRKQTQSDLSFEKVANDPIFKGIVDRIPNQPFQFAETFGFKHIYKWGVNGYLNSESGQGNQFFLSTVLAVTRNEGNSEKEALRQLLVSMRADETRPDGTFYFSVTGDVRSKTRQPNFRSAINELQRMGLKAEIIETVLPSLKRDVVGLTTGSPSFSWTASGSKILPGAICENLTSYGGKLDSNSQTKLSEFLRHDAAGSSGTVTEPYAIQAKFPHPMIHAHYAKGCSLAEAFYQSLQGPFQLLIVGDALCQPWAIKPKLTVSGVKPLDTVAGQIKLRLDTSNSPVRLGGMEMYIDGVLVHRGRFRETIQFDSTGIPDGFHEVRMVVTGDDRIQSQGHTVLPIQVSNNGHSTELKTNRQEYLETDEIVLNAKSNYGDSIELVHNMRPIAKKIGREAEFKIAARLLGRGPVKLEAIALSESGAGVSSTPVEIMIEGRIKIRRSRTTQPKRKAK